MAWHILDGAWVVAVYIGVTDPGGVALNGASPAEEGIGHLGKSLVVGPVSVVGGASHSVLPSIEPGSIWVQNVLRCFVSVAKQG